MLAENIQIQQPMPRALPTPNATVLSVAKPAHRTKLFVIGDGLTAQQVRYSLRNYPFTVVPLSMHSNYSSKIEPSAGGIIFAGKILNLGDTIASLKKNDEISSIPIHVAAAGKISDDLARELYLKGAATVVDFAKEKNIFASIIMEMQKGGPEYEAIEPEDIRISKAVWARASVVLDTAHKFKLWCHNGFVYIVGKFSSIMTKKKLEKVIMAAPGVEGIIGTGIHVATNRKVEKELGSMVERVIDSTPGINPTTLTYSVAGREVLLAGNVPNHGPLRRLKTRLRSLFGVKSVKNLAVVSKRRAQEDHLLALKLKEQVDDFFVDSKIDVTVMKNIVVLRGEVNLSSKRDLAEKLVENFEGVSKVVNKIEIIGRKHAVPQLK